MSNPTTPPDRAQTKVMDAMMCLLTTAQINSVLARTFRGSSKKRLVQRIFSLGVKALETEEKNNAW